MGDCVYYNTTPTKVVVYEEEKEGKWKGGDRHNI